MDVRQYAELFHSESRDHLTAYNHLVLAWEKDPDSREAVGGIFRAVHTIKGMAATMGYAAVADLSHRIENLLDVLRKGERDASPAVLDLLLRAGDVLEKGIGASVEGEPFAPPTALLEELDRSAGGAAPRPSRRSRDSGAMPAIGAGRQVRVVLRTEALLKGARALLVLRRAAAIGTVSSVSPAPQGLEQEDFDGRFSFRVEGLVTAAELEQALRAAGDVESVVVQSEAEAEASPVEAARGRHIRVDLKRLDSLMDEIGELAIARGRLQEIVGRLEDPGLSDVAQQLGRLAQSLQGEIIAARMTPVWQVFDRFPRMVRDLAKQIGRQVDFKVEGKEIELDRAILDEIGDPLMHLLRNAVDHGIEPPEERLRAGKDAAGRLVLSAVRERSTVAIRVSDDGRGVDRARVLQHAKEQGLVDAGQSALPDEDLFRFLARPGFSTATRVTDVSGRGVGIDVVATAARALGGSLEVRSEEGRGSTFTVRLPVTLAIMRALLARAGAETYALPLTHVAETVDPRPEDIQRVQGKEAMMLRGRLLPIVRLSDIVGTGRTVTHSRVPVIVLEMGERRTGVMVDVLLGQQEIVVKTFEAPRGMLPVFAGATILGDGKPALILDAGGLT
ncbi:MAG: chemotaxis protein CheA [Gemmatimonadales bacterium]